MGRKKIEDNEKKIAVTVYLKKSTVTANGGMDKMRTKIIEKFEP